MWPRDLFGCATQTFFGKDVDAHDVVFRFNAAPTRGYEATAGGRTDVRVINEGMANELLHRLNAKMSPKVLNAVRVSTHAQPIPRVPRQQLRRELAVVGGGSCWAPRTRRCGYGLLTPKLPQICVGCC
jgi:hypothetical protein